MKAPFSDRKDPASNFGFLPTFKLGCDKNMILEDIVVQLLASEYTKTKIQHVWNVTGSYHSNT